MKTIEQLINKLKEVDNNPNKIKKAEFVELGNNIKYVISPLTNNKVQLSTFVHYTIPYQALHCWEDLSRENLTNLFLSLIQSYRYSYKEEIA